MSVGSPEEVIAAIEAAVNANDLDAFISLHEPDAVVVLPPEGTVRAQGHDEIRAAMKPFFASMTRTTIEPQNTLQTDGVAMSHSRFTINHTRPSGEQAVKTGMGTVVSRLQPDDSWLAIFGFPFRA